MNINEFNRSVQQWIELSRSGKSAEAEQLYFDEIFDIVINRFKEKYLQNRQEIACIITWI